MTLEKALRRYQRHPDLEVVQLSNGARRALGVSKKGMRKLERQRLKLNRGLPGICFVCILRTPRDNVIISAHDEEAEAFARAFEARPDWGLLGLAPPAQGQAQVQLERGRAKKPARSKIASKAAASEGPASKSPASKSPASKSPASKNPVRGSGVG